MMHDDLKIFFDPSVKELIDSFSYVFNVRITFFSESNREYLVGYHLADSDFCSMMQTGLDARYRCIYQDNMMCKRCRKLGKRIIYRCHAGMNEAIIPVFIEKRLVAYAVFGQFRMHEEIPDSILQEWTEKGMKKEDIIKAFLERPLYKEEKLEKILHIFQSAIEYIISTDRLKLKKPQLLEDTIDYINRNIARDISLAEVSSYLMKSESTISHKIKETFGISFKDLLIEKKLNHFEALVKNDPEMPIMEASIRVGYQDPLYFSRLYRKKRGISPSEFIKDIKKANHEMLKEEAL